MRERQDQRQHVGVRELADTSFAQPANIVCCDGFVNCLAALMDRRSNRTSRRLSIPCWACRPPAFVTGSRAAHSSRHRYFSSAAARSARHRRRRAPTPRRPRSPPPPKATQIIMAIDTIGPGFNSHLLSDQSPVNAAISSLVLPSSFRPVADPASPTGSRWELDPTLLVSAEVTNDNPFTVTYKIRPEAQWTDNAPIAADDYWYLWRQMVSQPGVVDPVRLRPHHRRPVHRGRQDGGGDVLAAVSGVAGTVQRHPARAHRQGRAGRLRVRAGSARCR